MTARIGRNLDEFFSTSQRGRSDARTQSRSPTNFIRYRNSLHMQLSWLKLHSFRKLNTVWSDPTDDVYWNNWQFTFRFVDSSQCSRLFSLELAVYSMIKFRTVALVNSYEVMCFKVRKWSVNNFYNYVCVFCIIF